MEIKQRKQLTHVLLKDGRTLVSEATPKEIWEYLDNHSHIIIEWEGHSKYDIVNFVPAKVDDLETFILSQDKEIQELLRKKKNWLKRERDRIMDYDYAVSYVKNLLES